MSFSSLASPALAGARGLLQGPTLRTMARSLGIVLSAGALAASYQIAYEEGRNFVQGIRTGSASRRDRNMALQLKLMNSGFPLELQARLRRSRDGVRAGMDMLTNAKTPLVDEHAITLRNALTVLLTGESPGHNGHPL